MMDGNLLNSIAFDLVKEKVIQDKLEEAKNEENKNKKAEEFEEINLKGKDVEQDQFPEIDEVDSEEERIMQKEMQRRKEIIDSDTKKQSDRAKMKYGQVRDIVETEFLDTMLKHDAVVCHFYHNSFERCKIMDKHLKIIAESHPETLFVRIDAEKTPFFTSKLQIQILPTVILFKDGKAYDRVIGFEELGMRDDFPTVNLTRRLVRGKIITPINKIEKGEIKINKPTKEIEEDDYDY